MLKKYKYSIYGTLATLIIVKSLPFVTTIANICVTIFVSMISLSALKITFDYSTSLSAYLQTIQTYCLRIFLKLSELSDKFQRTCQKQS